MIRAEGEPGHGSKLFDGSAMERLQGAVARVFEFREVEFAKMRAGAAAGEVTSVNLAYLRGGVAQDASAPFYDAKFVMNLQPATAEAGFDMRIPYTQSLVEVERMMAQEWAPKALNLSYEFKGKARGYAIGGAVCGRVVLLCIQSSVLSSFSSRKSVSLIRGRLRGSGSASTGISKPAAQRTQGASSALERSSLRSPSPPLKALLVRYCGPSAVHHQDARGWHAGGHVDGPGREPLVRTDG